MYQEPFFLKPHRDNKEILYSCYDDNLEESVSFRALNPTIDLQLIHGWVTQPYAERFWQLNVDPKELSNVYEAILEHPLSHSFIGLLGEKIVCQIDCYHVSAEEIREHLAAGEGDCGLHILLCPPRESVKGLAIAMLKAFTTFFFSHEQATTLFGEPDIGNHWGNLAAKRAGFHFLETVQLSYKTANLYSITREQFQKTKDA